MTVLSIGHVYFTYLMLLVFNECLQTRRNQFVHVFLLITLLKAVQLFKFDCDRI